MSIIMEDCLSFNIADLMRHGLFDGGIAATTLYWTNGSAVNVEVDNRQQTMVLTYLCNGEAMKCSYQIVTKLSNLGKGVVRFFVCPVTRTLCRKLRLYGNRFVSGRAMRGALYNSQAASKHERLLPRGWASSDFIPVKRYGKPCYRNRMTPYGRRLMRYEAIVERCQVMAAEWWLRKVGRIK